MRKSHGVPHGQTSRGAGSGPLVADEVPDTGLSKHCLYAIINSIGDPVFVKDRAHRWVLLNDACCQFIGHPRERLLGKSDPDFFPKRQSDMFWAKDDQVFETGLEDLNEELLTDAAGRVRNISTKKTLHIARDGQKFIVGVIRDVTDQKRALRERLRLEDELRQTQKLEVVSRLAGGIAHDFSNILSAAVGASELMLEDLGPAHPQRKGLETILEACRSGILLTKRLLALGKRQALTLEALPLNDVISSMEKMFRGLLGEKIVLELKLEPGLWPPLADRACVEQLLINLVVNAKDAMPSGGRVVIETASVPPIPDHAAEGPPSAPLVQLTVKDTGIGMTPKVRAELFKPFFTTKPAGKGVGLGLPLVHSIMKQLGGSIRVESRPGAGTTFRLFFPKAGMAQEIRQGP